MRKKGARANLLGDATTRLSCLSAKKSWMCSQTRREEDSSSDSAKRKPRPDSPVLSLRHLVPIGRDQPNGEVTARVLHDSTNGLSVNTKTRLRDQERSPMSSDIKRAMREKASRGFSTFALTADVKEVDPRDWPLLGCHVDRGADVFVNTVGTFGITSASCYWARVSSAVGRLTRIKLRLGIWLSLTTSTWKQEGYIIAVVDGVLCALLHSGSPAPLVQDGWGRHRGLGRVRTSGHLSAKGPVVCTMGSGDGECRLHSLGAVRGMTGADHVRSWGA